MKRFEALTGRGGFTLTEVLISATILSGIGYVLSLSMRASDQSYATVAQSVEANATIREFTELMTGELKAANYDSIAVADANDLSSIDFQIALPSTGATPTWGAFERDLDIDEAECSQENWTIRYDVQQSDGGVPVLVRSILDDTGSVQHTKTLAENVTSFDVDEVGEVWVVELTTEGEEGIRHEEFDVRTRHR